MDFLKSITSKEALEIIGSFPVLPGTESVHIEEAAGRVLSQDILSLEDIPPFHRSLVDGFAVKARDTYGAKETNPAFLQLKGEIRVGEASSAILEDGSSMYISTGAMVPEGSDGVVMQEFVRRSGDEIEVTRSIFKGENICFKGEDVSEGAAVLKAGKKISAFDLGTLAALGISEVPVYRRPEVGLISSGDEIVGVDVTPSPGKVRDINRYTVSSLLKETGAIVAFMGIAPDNLSEVTERFLSCRESDMIIVSGGSSKGERDFVIAAIEGLGGTIFFHGINVKPGKPIIFGKLWGKPVFGLPGHPASCALTAIRFVLPLLRKLGGEKPDRERKVVALLTTNVPSSYGIEEYVRVIVEEREGEYRAAPVFSKSSVISSLSRASGYILIPEGKEGCEKDEQVEVFLFD
jgi:molybdopterin molybdotransferase